MNVRHGGGCSHNGLPFRFLHHAVIKCSSGLEEYTASIFKVTELAEVNAEGTWGKKMFQLYSMFSPNYANQVTNMYQNLISQKVQVYM